MLHDYKTRTIDYTEKHPPEWAMPEEKVNFYPKRVAKFICAEIDRVEKLFAEQKAKEHKTAYGKETLVGKEEQ